MLTTHTRIVFKLS